jgi:hypothetical protein
VNIFKTTRLSSEISIFVKKPKISCVKGLIKMASTIAKLPSEILVNIFSYLDQTDRHFRVAKVCKFWLELSRYHLTEKVVVCHQEILKPNHEVYSMYANRSGPKLTKSSCDWNIVAEKSWKFVKKLVLTRVGGSDLNDIITATKGICFPASVFACVGMTILYPPSLPPIPSNSL